MSALRCSACYYHFRFALLVLENHVCAGDTLRFSNSHIVSGPRDIPMTNLLKSLRQLARRSTANCIWIQTEPWLIPGTGSRTPCNERNENNERMSR